MYGRTSLILRLTLCVLLGQYTRITNGNVLAGHDEKSVMNVTLGVLKVSSRGLDLRYRLTNDSKQDIWVCEDVTVNYDFDHEVFLSEEGPTLMLRKRLDVPTRISYIVPPIGRYVRLPAGQTRTELLLLRLPVHGLPVFAGSEQEPTYRLDYARNLVLEIGYYSQDLPELVRKILEQADENSDAGRDELMTVDQAGIELDYGTVRLMKSSNKNLPDRAEQLLIPYSLQHLKGERFSRVTVEGLRIPFTELPPPEPWYAAKYLTERTPLEVLQDLFYDGEIELEDYRGAEVILNCRDHLYNGTARKMADIFRKIARGDQPPAQLRRLLDKIGDIEERDRVFAELRKKRAEGEQQESARIAELFRQANNRSNAGDDREALVSLDELFALAPAHEPAFHLRQAISARYIGKLRTNSIGMKLAWVPSGEFLMGTPNPGGVANEDHVHTVRISRGFWMGVCEVTQQQYKAIMRKNPSNFKGDDFPVETVSWYDAVEFCRQLSQKEDRKYRLPTEAEWEYACRAGTTTLYCWGDTQEIGLCNAENSSTKESSGRTYDRNVAVFRERGLPVNSTVPVASFKANAFGLHDMHGNVREWCQDASAWDYYIRSPRFQVDPQGLAHALTREFRGGGWRRHLSYCRSAYRGRFKPSLKLDDLGFRVVLEGTVTGAN